MPPSTPPRRRRAPVLPLALALLATGCAGGSLRQAEIALPTTYEAQPPVAPHDAAALDRWWRLFDDPQLTAMIERALASAPDARAALAVLDEARANRRQALSRYDPQGGFSGSATYQQSRIEGLPTSGGTGALLNAGETTTYSGGFSPSWEIGWFGRRGALRSSSEADLDAARFSYEASRQSLATGVASALFEARGLAVQASEARDSERVARDLAAIGARRVDAGIAAPVDALTLQSDLASAVATRTQREAQLAGAKRTLLVLIGRGVDRLDTLEIEPRLGAAPAIPPTTPGALLQRRPDVREAEARVRAASGALRLDQLALFPSFTLNPSATSTRISGDNGYRTNAWSLGANLLLPILDRPRLLAEIRAERARGEQAVIAYEKAVQTAYGEAESRLTTYMADRARLVQLGIAEASARDAFAMQRRGYAAGIVDLTTLLTAERTWRSARTQVSQSQATTLADAVDVFRALGGGWSDSAATIRAPS